MSENMLKIIKQNIKYIVLVAIGIVLLLLPTVKNKNNGTSNIEVNLKNTLEMVEGVGEINVMITCNSENIAEGAIIVAEGAGNPSVKKMLQDAAVSVLNLPEHKVQVMTKKR